MDRYDAARRRQARPGRSALGYWLPLVVTVTIATVGLAAWIWSERQQDDDHDNDRHDDAEDDTYDHPLECPDDVPQSRGQTSDTPDQGFLARMTGRTPSPQQLFDNAGQRIRSAVGLPGSSAVEKQQEGPDPAFSDNEHWNEEAETKRSQRPAQSSHQTNKSKRTVVVVLNGQDQDDEPTYRTEHAVSSTQCSCNKPLLNTI